MKKTVAAGAVVIIFILGAGGLILTKHGHKNSPKSTASAKAALAVPVVKYKPITTQNISIANIGLMPPNIAVKKGTVVTWTNSDTVAHSISESDGQVGPNSGTIAPGKTYSYTYNSTGTFQYHCLPHTSETGLVTVSD